MKYSAALGLQLSAEGGLGAAANRGIGVPGANDDSVVSATPIARCAARRGARFSPARRRSSSRPGSRCGPRRCSRRPSGPVRGYVGSYANGVAIAYELSLALDPAGVRRRRSSTTLVLPTGWTLDTSELGPGGGIGRLAHPRTRAARARLRIAPSRWSPSAGRPCWPELADLLRPDAALRGAAGLGRRPPASGRATWSAATSAGGVHAPLVRDQLHADREHGRQRAGTTSVMPLGGSTCRVTMSAPARADRPQPRDLGRAADRLAHLVAHAGEPRRRRRRWPDATWSSSTTTPPSPGATSRCRSRTCSAPSTAANPDYGLFPNDGGSAALHDAAAQHQTAFGCAGCTMALSGRRAIEFVGRRRRRRDRRGRARAAAESVPRRATRSTRWRPPGAARSASTSAARFQADSSPSPGSMSGLIAGESDVTLDELVFVQARDPNVTDPTLLQAVGGIGCARRTPACASASIRPTGTWWAACPST